MDQFGAAGQPVVESDDTLALASAIYGSLPIRMHFRQCDVFQRYVDMYICIYDMYISIYVCRHSDNGDTEIDVGGLYMPWCLKPYNTCKSPKHQIRSNRKPIINSKDTLKL